MPPFRLNESLTGDHFDRRRLASLLACADQVIE
jgi:hypothetical protein